MKLPSSRVVMGANASLGRMSMRFRTAVLSLGVMLAIAGPLGAQELELMSIGVKGGLTVSNVTATVGGSSADTDNRTGYNVAGVLSMAISPMFSVAVEGQIVGNGFGISDSTAGGTTGFDFLYLNFPA